MAAGSAAAAAGHRISFAGRARRSALAALALCSAGAASAQAPAEPQPAPVPVSEELAPLTRLLLEAIETLSDYRATVAPPPVFQLPQYRIEQKVCETPCNVRAAYVPREGIYLSANLDPVRDPLDRSALVHELVHHLQQGHAKFQGMEACARERAKEQEAYAIQNAYLAAIGHPARLVFYDDFDCEAVEAAR